MTRSYLPCWSVKVRTSSSEVVKGSFRYESPRARAAPRRTRPLPPQGRASGRGARACTIVTLRSTANPCSANAGAEAAALAVVPHDYRSMCVPGASEDPVDFLDESFGRHSREWPVGEAGRVGLKRPRYSSSKNETPCSNGSIRGAEAFEGPAAQREEPGKTSMSYVSGSMPESSCASARSDRRGACVPERRSARCAGRKRARH